MKVKENEMEDSGGEEFILWGKKIAKKR